MMSGFGWAKYPMINRMKDLRKDIPVTMMYGSRSWVDKASGESIKLSRIHSYVNLQVINGAGHHIYADRPEVFNRYVNDACAFCDDYLWNFFQFIIALSIDRNMEILLGIFLIIGIGICSGNDTSLTKTYNQPEDQYVNQKVHETVEKYNNQHEEEPENHENDLSYDFPQQHNQDQFHGGDNHYLTETYPTTGNQYPGHGQYPGFDQHLDYNQQFGYDQHPGNDQHLGFNQPFGYNQYPGHDQHPGFDNFPHQIHDNHGNHMPDYSPHVPSSLPYNFNQKMDHNQESKTDDTTFDTNEDEEEEYHQPDLYYYQNPFSPPIIPQMDFGLMGQPGFKGNLPLGVGRPVPPQTQPYY
uniref:Uncharacterized protein n=1 Tax=Phlebotomus papatasi TaxID=29031 RepID=A0A1B0GMC5_PHLPP